MKFFKFIRKVRKEDDGAVTVDWVVLTAAVVVLGAVVMTAINGKVSDLATSIGNYIGGQDTVLKDKIPKP